MFNKTEIVPKRSDTMTFYESSFASIKSDLCDIANSYLNIAYKVHEIDVRIRKDGRKCKYKNIVEACELELGFKKSTTYNMLNIVKNYAVDDKGNISYKQLLDYSHYSYSQLVEMLSLGTEQRAAITPDTPVSAIRMLKKPEEKKKPEASRSSGKTPEPVQTFQTSGKNSKPLERSEVLETVSFSAPDDYDVDFQYSVSVEDDVGDISVEFNDDFCHLVDSFTDDLIEFYDTLRPLFVESDFDQFDPDDLEKRFSYIMHVYRSAYNSFKKQQDLQNKSAV